MLIVFRAIAGIGAAAVFSMVIQFITLIHNWTKILLQVFVVVADLVPLEKRASYQG
jgi:hypothetical protein